jgi:ABC-type transporter MlaC component
MTTIVFVSKWNVPVFSRVLRISLGILIYVLILSPQLSYARDVNGEQFVTSLGNELLRIVNTKKIANSEIQTFRAKFIPRLHKEVPRILAGRDIWVNMNDETRRRYVAAIQNYLASMSLYVLRNHYVDKIIIDGSSDIRVDKKIIVNCTLTRSVPHKLPKQMQWKLMLTDNNYYIFDIDIDGMSLLTGRQNEINSVLDKNGRDVNKLINILNEKANKLQLSSQEETD